MKMYKVSTLANNHTIMHTYKIVAFRFPFKGNPLMPTNATVVNPSYV